jgi:hypothetical protein
MISNVQANAKPSYFVPQSVLVLEKAYSEIGFPPPHENSNNPLAAEPESENDATRFFQKALSISHFGWSGGFQRRQKDLFK